jgi:hypothetical protein
LVPLAEKQNYYRRENIIPDPRNWWANGNIICNEHCRYRNRQDETQYWGDQFLTQLRDMYDCALAALRESGVNWRP